MADASTIQIAIGSIKTAAETVKSLINLRDLAMMQSKAIELQTQILSAQGSALEAYETQTTLLREVRELKEEMARMKTWDAEKQRYELKKLGHEGVFAYALKADAQGAEPPHWICPDCYQKGEKSVLQQITRYPGRADVRLCQRCGWEIYVSGGWMPDHAKAKRSH